MDKYGFRFKTYLYIVSVLAITLWGISYIWTDKLIGLGIPVFYFVFVRIFLAGICLLLLNKAHIGEVQAGAWPTPMIEKCRKHNIILL